MSYPRQQAGGEMTAIQTILLSNTTTAPDTGTKGSAGIDLACDEPFILQPNERRLIGTGIAMAIPEGMWGEIKPRSSLAVQYGIDIMAGVIDSDYRGEIKVLMHNTGNRPLRCLTGDRIAQMVIQKHEAVKIMLRDELDNTVRGSGGFGSTGK